MLQDINTQRIVLHADMNSFYANVECLMRPEIREFPVAVGGNAESRHGIILAKNRLAKAAGVKTGEALWEARRKCPNIVIVPPNYPLYLRVSRMARAIYYDYSDLVEPFGPDEAWIDCTRSAQLFGGDPLLIAREISERVKAELGVTVSVGVSWNKIFAKFGSDTDQGDGIIHITTDNYQKLVWPAPVEELLYVGRATKVKLAVLGISTIGELAQAPPAVLRKRLGKIGELIQLFAMGGDTSPVKVYNPAAADVTYLVKGIGNGLTAPHDIACERDAKALIFLLAESVAQRLRANGLRAGTVCIHVRDAELSSYTRQMRLPRPSNLTRELSQAAFKLLQANEPLDSSHPLRALAIRTTSLTDAHGPVQLELFGSEEKRLCYERLDCTMDALRGRFGNNSVRSGACLADPAMAHIDIKRDNIVHPVGFFAE